MYIIYKISNEATKLQIIFQPVNFRGVFLLKSVNYPQSTLFYQRKKQIYSFWQ